MHGEIEELLGAYALHATEPEEDREIEAHLAIALAAGPRYKPTWRWRPCWELRFRGPGRSLGENRGVGGGDPLPGAPTSCPSCTPLARFPLCDNEAPDAGR